MKTLIDKISDEDWNDPSVSDWNINVGHTKGHGGLGMTDIVKRLRRYCADTGLKSHTIDEAADEIERLRCALAHITNIKNEMYGGDWDEIEHARSIARAALEGSK